MLTNIVALTAGLAATASAFDCNGHYFSFFNRAGPMSYQRLDPGLFPGVESPHLHSFDGGNGLSASMGFDTTQDSSCTTARIKPDKSLYWRPTLFFGNQTGFYRVPEKASKTYYKSGDGDKWANVTEFPEDFNMIAGDPYKRSDGNNAAGVRWGCHQPDGRDDKIFAPGFPTGFTSCAYGFASEVTFPSCWNGNKLDPKQPSAHMAYPTNGAGVGIENCPTTHRAARFPTIFMEFWYDISEFDGQYSADSAPWVLANGDPTGFGFHADFMNGWEKGVLAKATGETGGCNCGCGCGNDEMKQCFGADNVNDDNDASFKQCSASNSFDSLSSSHFDKLPGCNPIQSGPARATMASGAGCAAATGIAGSGSNSTATGTPASSAKATPTSGSYDDASSAVTSSSKDATTTSAAKSGSGNSNTDAKTTSSSTPKSSASPSYASVDLSNKGLANAGGAGYEPVNPSEVAAKPTPSTPSNASNGKESDCKPTTTVTVTPTVYVTVGAQNATSTLSSVYKTLTKTAFVTLSASY